MPSGRSNQRSATMDEGSSASVEATATTTTITKAASKQQQQHPTTQLGSPPSPADSGIGSSGNVSERSTNNADYEEYSPANLDVENNWSQKVAHTNKSVERWKENLSQNQHFEVVEDEHTAGTLIIEGGGDHAQAEQGVKPGLEKYTEQEKLKGTGRQSIIFCQWIHCDWKTENGYLELSNHLITSHFQVQPFLEPLDIIEHSLSLLESEAAAAGTSRGTEAQTFLRPRDRLTRSSLQQQQMLRKAQQAAAAAAAAVAAANNNNHRNRSSRSSTLRDTNNSLLAGPSTSSGGGGGHQTASETTEPIANVMCLWKTCQMFCHLMTSLELESHLPKHVKDDGFYHCLVDDCEKSFRSYDIYLKHFGGTKHNRKKDDSDKMDFSAFEKRDNVFQFMSLLRARRRTQNNAYNNLDNGLVACMIRNKNLALTKTLCAANDHLKVGSERKLDVAYYKRLCHAGDQFRAMVKNHTAVEFRAKIRSVTVDPTTGVPLYTVSWLPAGVLVDEHVYQNEIVMTKLVGMQDLPTWFVKQYALLNAPPTTVNSIVDTAKVMEDTTGKSGTSSSKKVIPLKIGGLSLAQVAKQGNNKREQLGRKSASKPQNVSNPTLAKRPRRE